MKTTSCYNYYCLVSSSCLSCVSLPGCHCRCLMMLTRILHISCSWQLYYLCFDKTFLLTDCLFPYNNYAVKISSVSLNIPVLSPQCFHLKLHLQDNQLSTPVFQFCSPILERGMRSVSDSAGVRFYAPAEWRPLRSRRVILSTPDPLSLLTPPSWVNPGVKCTSNAFKNS